MRWCGRNGAGATAVRHGAVRTPGRCGTVRHAHLLVLLVIPSVVGGAVVRNSTPPLKRTSIHAVCVVRRAGSSRVVDLGRHSPMIFARSVSNCGALSALVRMSAS